MKILYSKIFIEKYRKLPMSIQKQVDKQIQFLANNHHHPSLNAKKMKGEKFFEARVSRGYRMRYEIQENIITMLIVGTHDEGLGKK